MAKPTRKVIVQPRGAARSTKRRTSSPSQGRMSASKIRNPLTAAVNRGSMAFKKNAPKRIVKK